MGLGVRGRDPQAPSPISAPKPSFRRFRCSGRLIELKLKRSTSRFASLTLRCRTESAFQAVPVFRMAYFPYLTAFRMQAKQIQRLPVVGQDICQNWTTYLSKVSVLLESQNCTISFKKRPSLPRLQRGPLGYEVIPFLCPNQPCSAKRQSHQSAYPGQHYYTLRPRHAIAP